LKLGVISTEDGLTHLCQSIKENDGHFFFLNPFLISSLLPR
jgi:hypothetical protein